MAGRGNRAKSTQEHLRNGTYREDRHGRHRTPEAPAGTPEKPPYLSEVASAMWDQLAAIMEREGRLTVNDGPFLEDAAECYAELARWRVAAQRSPLTQTKVTVDSAGNEHREEKPHPAQQQYRLASEAWRKKLVEGGLTPTARNRVRVSDQDQELDEFTRFQRRLPR